MTQPIESRGPRLPGELRPRRVAAALGHRGRRPGDRPRGRAAGAAAAAPQDLAASGVASPCPAASCAIDESLDEAARRVLADKVGLSRSSSSSSTPSARRDRDPRLRVISVAYYALVDQARLERALERRDGARARAHRPCPGRALEGGPAGARDADERALPLAFDHADILGMVVKRLRGKLDYAPIGFQLLPRALHAARAAGRARGRARPRDSTRTPSAAACSPPACSSPPASGSATCCTGPPSSTAFRTRSAV